MFDLEKEQMQTIDRLHAIGDFYKAKQKANDKWEKRCLHGSFLFMFPSLLIPYTPVKFIALALQLVVLGGFLYFSKRGMKLLKEHHRMIEVEQEYISKGLYE